MLESLIIKNFVVVEFLEIGFDEGFSVFTGETGAGKSMIIEALSLLLGKRAATIKIREGSERAEIAAIFKVRSKILNDFLANWCHQSGFDFDSDEIFIRRVIEKTGKSRAWINGHISSINQIKEIGEHLMEIHSQNAHQKLLTSVHQRKILDDFAEIKKDVDELKKVWDLWQEKNKQLDQSINKNEFTKQQLIQLKWKISLIEDLNLKKNEWEALSLQENKLSFITELIENAKDGINKIQQDENSIISIIEKLQKKFLFSASKDEFFSRIAKSAEQSVIELKDITDSLRRYIGQNDIDPYALKQTEERISEIFLVAQKIGCDPKNLEKILELSKKELIELELENNIEILKIKVKELKNQYIENAELISKKRIISAKNFEVTVSNWLKKLAMDSSVLYVEIVRKEKFSSSGMDEINFLIKHAGSEKGLGISKVASGGELSRISLAISVVMANASKTPSLIFDEVDSGIGGNTAHTVGELLRFLGKEQQILCVTHLPQVAVNGHHHFKITKGENNSLPTSKIDKIIKEDRVTEVARMLGKKEHDDKSIEYARNLLRE
ncbi:MAG: DNA repair protein RecN [Betaproteobacteria bacterium TMED156]|nr:MAG: DNA repair protein RecN [Betaproteobacteria bacterium TMED156]|tara:strand:+ start:735 stop:2399 length:1665 start_codon:yes stop_codon:yes gene_type:complete